MVKYKIVLGGSKGIGKSISLAFTRSHEAIIVVSREKKNLDFIKEEAATINKYNRNIYLSIDMSNESGFLQLFDYIDRNNLSINGLINNLPGGASNTFNDYSSEDIYASVDKKVIPYLKVIKYSVKYIHKSGGGSIVNIVGSSWKNPDSNMFVNSFINAALVNASMNISKELATQNININCVHPGYIYTGRYINYVKKYALKYNILTEEAERLICQNIPINEIGNPNDLADLVVFLTREKSKYITGQNIDFDGGLSINF